MTGMGYCELCDIPVPTLELVMHVTQAHDGFREPGDQMEAIAYALLSSLRLTRWARVCAWFHRLAVAAK
jgi:hypothetical protein